jgi:hypothetical protein
MKKENLTHDICYSFNIFIFIVSNKIPNLTFVQQNNYHAQLYTRTIHSVSHIKYYASSDVIMILFYEQVQFHICVNLLDVKFFHKATQFVKSYLLSHTYFCFKTDSLSCTVLRTIQ